MQNISIGPKAIFVRFFRVAAGDEQTAVRELMATFPDALLCKVFGTADFAVVQELDKWEEAGLVPIKPNFRVFDILPVRCFTWRDRLDWATLTADHHGLVAFCFLKLNEELLKQQGVQIESHVAGVLDRMNSDDSTVRVHPLGALGWHELLLLVTGNNMKDLQSFIINLRGAFNSTEDGRRIIDSTTTVVSIRCLAKGPVSDAVFGGIVPTLHVACRPGTDMVVRKEIKQAFGESADWSFGINDFACRIPDCHVVADYVRKLWDFRSDNRTRVLRTLTMLSGPPEERSATDGIDAEFQPKRLPFRVPAPYLSRLKRLERQNRSLYLLLLATFDALDGYSRDPQMSDAFADLWPFGEHIRNAIVEKAAEPDDDVIENIELLSTSLEILLFGIHQRAVGMGIFWERESASFLYPNRYGGIHRALTALSDVAHYCMEAVGCHWTGFFVVGFTGDFHRYSGGAMNAPWEAIDRPGSWLAVAHEAGHEFGAQRDLIADERLQSVLDDADWTGVWAELLIWEVISQIFGCNLAYGQTAWRKYTLQSWRYIAAHPAAKRVDRVHSVFLRLLLSVLYFEWKEKGANPPNIEHRSRRLVEQLSKAVPSSKLRSIDFRRDVEVAERLLASGLLPALSDLIPDVDLGQRDLRSIRRRLKSGAILFDMVNPCVVLRAVEDLDDTRDWRAGIAALLTLWHQAKTRDVGPNATHQPGPAVQPDDEQI